MATKATTKTTTGTARQLPIHAAMVAVMRGVESITKASRNAQQGFMYRGIDDVYNALHGLLAEHGIVTVPRVTDERCDERVSASNKPLFHTTIRVEYDFIAGDGSLVTVGPVIGQAMDSGDKAANKALAVAHKYVLLQTFCIPTAEDKDPDATTHDTKPQSSGTGRQRTSSAKPKDSSTRRGADEVISSAQRKRMFALLNMGDHDEDALKTHLKDKYGIDSTKELLKSQYDDVCEWIES
jgi:hypothetical protein